MENPDKKPRDNWLPFLEMEKEKGKASIFNSFRPCDETIIEDQEIAKRDILPSTLSFEQAKKTQHASDIEIVQPSSVSTSRIYRDFCLGERIGEGGMGVVFRGKQTSLNREVAIKVMRGDAKHLAMFTSEAQITGGLQHGNIVPIYHFGQTIDGIPHIAMKLIEGTSWADVICGKRPVPLKEHLQILLKVCNAVAYAHEQKIIHRDLKPENIMVGEFGEVFVMDWGLAVSISDSVEDCGTAVLHVSQVDSPAGTPAYMAPELANGHGHEQNVWTDIYLLGACLHEVLTGKARHAGPTMVSVLFSAIESKPFAYTDEIPDELAAICNRAMAKSPGERYQSVREFQRNLEEFLEHAEANVLITKGTGLLEELREAISEFHLLLRHQREERGNKIQRLHGEIVFAFEHALEIWPESREANDGLAKENRLMMQYALVTEDVSLASYLLSRFELPEYAEQVRQLHQRMEARRKELAELRETARRYDWREISSPVGTTFLFAGIAGALGCFLTAALQKQGILTFWSTKLLWGGVVAAIAIVAYFNSRAIKINSFISGEVIGTWGAIALSCFLTGTVNQLLGLKEFQAISTVAFMIGIGIASMAFRIRKWLLAPAAAFFLGGMLMAAIPEYALEIFGLLWLMCLTTIGISFKLVGFLAKKDNPGKI